VVAPSAAVSRRQDLRSAVIRPSETTFGGLRGFSYFSPQATRPGFLFELASPFFSSFVFLFGRENNMFSDETRAVVGYGPALPFPGAFRFCGQAFPSRLSPFYFTRFGSPGQPKLARFPPVCLSRVGFSTHFFFLCLRLNLPVVAPPSTGIPCFDPGEGTLPLFFPFTGP